MRIGIVALNSNLIHSNEQSNIIEYLNKKLYEIGEKVSLISYFDNNYERLRSIVQENYDLIFFIGTDEAIYNYNVKNNLSRIVGDKLANNDSSYTALKKYCNDNNIVFSMQEESEVMLPSNAIPLVSSEYYNNGFMHKFNNTYIVFLPENIDFVKINYESYILPLVREITMISSECQVIKCFGILEKDIRSMISDYFALDNITINIISDNLDSAIYIRYNKDCDHQKTQSTISDIVSILNKFIYALEDVSIYEMATQLLKLYNKTISIGETITLGNITRELSQLNSNLINDSHIYLKFDAMKAELGLDNKVIDQFGKYSVNSVYELCNGLLEKYGADNALFVLADNDIRDICYVAVGDLDGIHVYKNKINTKDLCYVDNISKTAIFYLIKKLKQNSLQFR